MGGFPAAFFPLTQVTPWQNGNLGTITPGKNTPTPPDHRPQGSFSLAACLLPTPTVSLQGRSLLQLRSLLGPAGTERNFLLDWLLKWLQMFSPTA